MNITAVTGITGKSGYWFYQRVCTEATVLTDMRSRAASRSQGAIETIAAQSSLIESCIGDIGDESFCKKLCSGADTLIHIAGIRQSFPLLDIAAQCGIKRFILVHTTGMYSKYKKAAKPYIDLERRIHELAENYGISVTILRPTMIYGTLNDRNLSTFIRMVDKLRIFPVINGARYELQPVHAKDLGEAYYSVLMHPETTTGKSYNCSGGAPVMLIDMLKTISHYLGKKTRFISVPFWLAYSGSWFIYLVTFSKVDYREKVQRMIEPRVFDHLEAAADFGYSPMAFAEGVRSEVVQYMSRRG